MKKHVSNIILIVAFIAGLSLLLYPSVSDYWNSLHASRVIANYAAEVANLDQEEYDQIWQDSIKYNQSLMGRDNRFLISEEQKEQYQRLLNLAGNGIMGYIEIPSIAVSLPIYHGTSEAVLQEGVGHLEWTSLPVGGENTHCVLSGHRGLPSARLFTDLDKLTEGDTFLLYILDETLMYEVDQILIVEPEQVDALLAEKGKDYCTLVTCTPYGINSHRMLVRGHRVETERAAAEVRVSADAVVIEPIYVAPFIGTLLLIVGMMLFLAADFIYQKVQERK